MSKPLKTASPSNPFRFVHEGFRSYQARWLVQQGKLVAIGRSIYQETSATPEDIQSGMFSVFAYRCPEYRLMGESARRVFQAGMSPVIQTDDGKQVVFASGEFSQRRERPLIAPVDLVLRPERRDAEGRWESPFLIREKKTLELHDHGTALFYPVSPAQMLLDSILYPECAVAPQHALEMLESLPENHRKRLLDMEDARESILEWKRMAHTSSHPAHLLHKSQEITVWLQDAIAGSLSHNGIAWHAEGRWSIPGVEPEAFLQSLMPETVENQGDEHLQSGDLGDTVPFMKEPRRLMNLVFIPESHSVREQPSRNLIQNGAELSRYVDHQGIFTGQCMDNFFRHETWMSHLLKDSLTPKLSGMQPKVAAFLNTEGQLSHSQSISDPFTIVSKMDPAATANITGIPVLEWVCQRATRMAGLPTPETALVVSVTGQAATILSERFDVPQDKNDRSLRLAVDGGALMGISADKKYKVSTQALWKSIEKHFNDEQRRHEAEAFFDRFALAWAMADGDLHAKNISVLFQAETIHAPWKAQMAPIYDTVCTRALPGFENDLQALPIEGQRKGLNPGIWDRFGKSLGIPHGGDRASEISARLLVGFQQASEQVTELFDGLYRKSVEGLLDRAHTAIENRAMTILQVSESDLQRVRAENKERESQSMPIAGPSSGNPVLPEDHRMESNVYCQN